MAESATPDGAPEPNPNAPSISAAATAYQAAMQPQSATPTAMQPQSATPTSAASPSALPNNMTRDVEMSDRTPDRVPSPAIAPGTSNNAASPMPARTGTPSRPNGNDMTSRATSQHPDPAPTIPKEAPPHGAPVRQYLNGKVTGVLLDGMKLLAKEQPNDPLRVLGEYLLQKSREVEGTSS